MRSLQCKINTIVINYSFYKKMKINIFLVSSDSCRCLRTEWIKIYFNYWSTCFLYLILIMTFKISYERVVFYCIKLNPFGLLFSFHYFSYVINILLTFISNMFLYITLVEKAIFNKGNILNIVINITK